MTVQDSRRFPCDPATPGRARAWALAMIRSGLGADAATMLLDDAALVVSELMTNALRAGARMATLTLSLKPGHLRVAVQDDVVARPQLLQVAPGQLHGRGLHIVAALADDWGFTRLARGKEVWADLSLIHVRAL